MTRGALKFAAAVFFLSASASPGIGASPTQLAPSEASAAALLKESEAAESSGALDAALEKLSASIALMPQDRQTAALSVEALTRQSKLLFYAGRSNEAMEASRKAYETARNLAPDAHPLLHRATLSYAEELVDALRLGQAEMILRGLLEDTSDGAAAAETRYELARIIFKQERREDAATLIAQASRLASKLPSPDHAELLGNIALEQARQAFENSKLDAALAALDNASRHFEAMGPTGRVSREIARQARLSVLINAGRWQEANALLATGLEAARNLPVQSRIRQNSEMVSALLRSFDPAQAKAALADVVPLYEAIKAPMHSADRTPAERASDATRARVNLSRFAAIALRAGDMEHAFAAAQYMAWSDVSASTASVARRLAMRDPARGARIQEAERLAELSETLRSRRNFASEHDSPEAQALSTRLTETEAAYRAIYRQLAEDGAQPLKLGEPEIRSLTQAQASLAPGRALLLLIPTDNRLVTLIVRQDRVAWSEAELSIPAMKENAARLRRSLTLAPGRPHFDRKAALLLGNAIMNPGAQKALEGITEIELMAAGPILSVPPAVLLSGRYDVKSIERLSLAKLPFLIHQFAFSFRPALGAGTNATHSKGGFAGIGAPILAATRDAPGGTRALEGAALDLATLPSLANAERELNDLALALGNERQLLLTGSSATEAQVKAADLRGFRTMVFATHGLMAGDFAGLSEPALVLTPQPGGMEDGLLTASEIAMLAIDAEWVILSACNSGVGREPGSSTYSGLARAFMQAGAGNLLVSLWPVRDDAARHLSLNTIVAYDRGLGRAAALRQAMLGLMADRTVPEAADPAIWGAFSLVER
jgi:CHAT domain-containing protein/predicted negative regulator of RcsB-dependent stress response